MCNKYEYLYLDYTYSDKRIGVLRSLGGFSNSQDLDFFENAAVTKR